MSRIITSEKGKESYIDKLTDVEHMELMGYVQHFRLLTNRLVLTDMEVEFGAFLMLKQRKNQSFVIEELIPDDYTQEEWDDWKGWSELHDGD